ncbi:MAG: glutathione S-transferase family protein [Gammaproteobacteria bacterium]
MVILYGINLSTFTRKVRLALLEKGIEHKLEVAPMGSPKIRAMHPLGQIPVLEDRGETIPDSSVIIAYLERAYPATPLYPAAAGAMARALWLEEYADTQLRKVTLPFFTENVVKPLFQGKPGDAQALADAAAPRDQAFAWLEQQLGDASYAVGEALTVADVAIGAQLITCFQGNGELDPVRWPRLKRYVEGLFSRPLWAPILAEEEAALNAAQSRRASK